MHSVKNTAQESLRPWSASALQRMGLARDGSRIIASCNEFWSVLQQGSTNVSMNAINQFFLHLTMHSHRPFWFGSLKAEPNF